MTVRLTPVQRENLAKLATFLTTNAASLHFHMGAFRGVLKAGDEFEFSNEFRIDHTPPCGSVGCAIGHGPNAGIEPIDADKGDWSTYAARVFGTDPWGYNSDLWEGLFTADWQYLDNSPEGAAQRITRFLETGELVGARDA